MPLGTDTNVEDIQGVQDKEGTTVPPASGDFAHVSATGHELDSGNGGGTVIEAISAPDRAEQVTIHVSGWDGSGHVVLAFQDADGNDITTRDDGDSSAYGTDGARDVFVTAAVASPHLEVRIVDDSGASNVVSYSVYVR